VNAWPYEILEGAEVMVGRVASVPSDLKRYGGENIWAVNSLFAYDTPPPSPLPLESTRASGSSSAVEW